MPTKLSVQCDKDFLYHLKAQALQERTTLTELVNRVLREYIEKQDGPAGPTDK